MFFPFYLYFFFSFCFGSSTWYLPTTNLVESDSLKFLTDMISVWLDDLDKATVHLVER